ncbi:DinB family protein [Thermoactinospora rubra]|uniref:DinB family protein n=1 Tax=Thermoactinospora rubra TaxID=1088767 RepID=UPI000A10C508|nr:DinB family protein [Thermoactinospora rubra]
MDWTAQLLDQLDWHWTNHLRPRLDGLTDEEYFWEPVPGCWNVRRREEADPAKAHGSGDYVIEYEWPEPAPPPVTTIAWRLGHIIVGIFGTRSHRHFGAPETDYDKQRYAGTAKEALAQLDAGYAHWTSGVRSLSADDLARPVGPAEGAFADHPMAALVLHINREVIHHGAEIALLRDLYLRR